MPKKIKIGLFGYGVVGQGLYEVLQNSKASNAEIVRICVKSPGKPRNLPAEYFTTDADDIFNDPEINLIVELIDSAEDAYKIVTRALKCGLPVVSGNKAMLAQNLREIIELQKTYGTALLYDASACGSIPVIRNLEEYYDNDLLLSVKGILNGSSNFILTRIFNDGVSYDDALRQAQELGFAESDPSFDVDGFDSLFKIVIICVHAFGTWVEPARVFNYGISNINEFDIRHAREKGVNIKLVGQVKKLSEGEFTMFVMPEFVTRDKYIYNVEDEFNGVVIKGQSYGKQFMFGRGAGGHPTASAVLSDIMAHGYNYRYEYKKRNYADKPAYTTSQNIKIYLRYRSEEDRRLFPFSHEYERYYGETYNYVIGEVRLSELLKIRDELPGRDIFIATQNY
jgi:homoserine dehydrogenase